MMKLGNIVGTQILHLSVFLLIFIGFVTGWGQVRQDTCRTNGKGPEIYTKCAAGSIFEYKGKTKKEVHLTVSNGRNDWNCIGGATVAKLDPPCYGFNSNSKHKEMVSISLF